MNKCCICLCVYNNEFGLPYVLKNIKELEKVFEKTQVLVFFDQSKDKSYNILQEYQKKYNNMEIILNNNQKSELRTENIANARNGLLKKIREKYIDYEYFIMMDSNEYSCIGDIKVEPIKEILQRKEEWDSISFDREAGYYDTWALSFDPYIYSFFHFNNWQKLVEMMRQHFNKLLEEYRKNPNQLIEVYSAFNGFAIYKTEKFINCSYSADINLSIVPLQILKKEQELTQCRITNNMKNDCEHRKFHFEAIKKNNAKIKISVIPIFCKFPNPPKNLRGPA